MTPFEAEIADEQYRGLQAAIADEWRISGETDGHDGKDSEHPDNVAYMSGYEPARAQWISNLYYFDDKGQRHRTVDPGDCTWLYGNDEEF